MDRMRQNGLLLWLGVATALSGCGDLSPGAEGLDDLGPPVVDAEGKADGEDVPAWFELPADADLDQPFQVLFAPDDPVATTELAMIQRVRDARAADPADYPEGDNPYAIRYAVYNLRNPALVGALADAHDEGVDVQVLIDAKQLDPARTWNTADEELIERGFEFVSDNRDLTSATELTADLVGVKHSGLMHFKTRIFETPEGRTVISGSMNPGDNAVLNEETFHVINDPALTAQYADAYERIRDGDRIPNEWDDAAAVNVLFTPAASGPRARDRVLQWILEEDELILLMVFSFRDITAEGGSLVRALSDKARAGVPVYVITDRKQSDGVDANGNRLYRNDGTEDRLRDAGVHVWEATNRRTEFTAMHHKAGIFGLTSIRVITDAANWTFSGLGSGNRVARNYESQLFIDSDGLDGGRTGRRYLSQWLRVLERYADQSADDGEPSYPEVRDTLMALPSWPMQAVRFRAEVETQLGEEVYVRGDADALGAWDRSAVRLATDGTTYPWWSSVDAVFLPLASTFAWKLTAEWPDGRVRWERGEDRPGVAVPSALITGDAAALEARWR